jgi:phosphoribosyl 1,2-cyclic phosphodiesterase
MRVTSLASGSSGNALLVEAGPGRRTRLLVDAGLPGKILIERLRRAGTHPTQLQGVLVTHEHSDHIIGLPVLRKRYAIPVITAPDTLAAIEQSLASTWLDEWVPTTEDLSKQGDLKGSPLQYTNRSQKVVYGERGDQSDQGEDKPSPLPWTDRLPKVVDSEQGEDGEQGDQGNRGGQGDHKGSPLLWTGFARSPKVAEDKPSPLLYADQLPKAVLSTQDEVEIMSGEKASGNGFQCGVGGEMVSYMDTLAMPLQPGSRCQIGDIEVISFPVPHDALAPCGYLLSAGGCRVCIVIDSGEVTPIMLEAMQHADLLVLESNHDRERLLRGPYPHHLKMRILSPTGHLSNDQAADAVLHTWRTDSVRWLWLSHLSRTNNTPKLALKSMLARLEAARANLDQVHISVLPPGMGNVWDSTQLWESPALWDMPL